MLQNDHLQSQARHILVRNLNRSERADLLLHLVARHARESDVSAEELFEFAATLNGFTSRDIVNFVADVSVHCAGLSLAQLTSCKRQTEFVPDHLAAFVADVAPLRWRDIGGYETVKTALRRAISEPLLRDQPIAARGVLLHGPPGCSKTMFARALATECGLFMFSVQPSSVLRGFLGDSEKRLLEILTQAEACAPSIVFIDEIDMLFPRESSSPVTNRMLAVLFRFLLDNRSVILVVATNYRQQVDHALLCRSRLALQIEIPLPDAEARQSILRIIFDNDKFAVSPEVTGNIPAIAERLAGRSGAEIVDFGWKLKKSIISSQSSLSISMADVDAALPCSG